MIWPAIFKTLADAGKKAGRQKLPVSMFGVGPNAEHVKKFLDLGIDRLIFALPPATRETVLPLLYWSRRIEGESALKSG